MREVLAVFEKVYMEFIGYLYALGGIQGLTLCGVLLLSPGVQRPANYFMAGLVIMISLRLLQSWLISSDTFLEHPKWALHLMPLNFTWGPLLYLYAYSLSLGTLRWSQAVHFLPAAALLIGFQSLYPSDPQQQKELVETIWYQGYDPENLNQTLETAPTIARLWLEYHLHAILFVVHFGIYCLLILQALKRHNHILKSHFSSLERMNLRWLKWLTIACLAYLLMFLLFGKTPVLLQSDTIDRTAFRYVYLVGLLYAIAIAAIFQPNIVRGTLAAKNTSQLNAYPADQTTKAQADVPRSTYAPSETSKTATDSEEQKCLDDSSSTSKYQRSTLTSEEVSGLSLCLENVMESKKLYLRDDLTLPDLADEAGISAHHASQVLNSQINKNFYSFVNHYRIEKAKKLLLAKDSQKLKIVDIAIEVGFKSKSSFYDAFKKELQMTPTQYKKHMKDGVTSTDSK